MGNHDETSVRSGRFESVLQEEIPRGREGKHKQIIGRLMQDLDRLSQGLALKIPLAELPDSKENIRSALNRAAHQRRLPIATSSNQDYLYIWKVESDSLRAEEA